ncbi:MAG TPA: sigma-54-dependent Fis family transcriptional regulator [Caldithrix abyssi]|uniref:Sigma-54-dependent Fis family transcriptional regulator n=1 Tax=Caldithrix abyssi TaxID=187145 RepID=A0A7V4TZ35_CALAY|nr:sigma-54-dependent Fis family transcriptional regulator [Caldithrix abyssi]
MSLILAVDNEERMCKLIKTSLELDGFEVDYALGGREAIDKISQKAYDIIITDLKMDGVDGLQVLDYTRNHSPQSEVILITAFATQETALEAMKKGAYDYLIKPFKMDELSLRARRIIRQKELEEENKRLKQMAPRLPDSFPGIIGKSKNMREVFRKIKQVAQSDTAVHIRGESGTGKELVAQAIHQNSKRSAKAFVAINCAALPENLLESELFGFEKGAFTGATHRKAGLFEQAEGGTIFLDEIGDLPLALQAKLLRVLQNNEITHLGGQNKIKVDFRLITATHRNLEQMIEAQQFRSDLYYRINIFPIHLPPLRERKEDIPELIQHFLKNHPEKTLSRLARLKLMEYDYPGNVRELENIISRSALLYDDLIEDVDIPVNGLQKKETEQPMGGWEALLNKGIRLDELEKELIQTALRLVKGNKSKAADLLGITRRRLYSMMERFGIGNE